MLSHARRALGAAAIAGLATPILALPAHAASGRAHNDFESLYLDGRIVRTFGTPANLPNGGIDPIYAFASGASDQLSVSSVGPGTGSYHGGRWQVYVVSWNTSPYLITSDEAVLAAQAAGDITITRNAAADFRCPVLP